MLQSGDVLARKYQIVKMLGAGGMSNIYLCRIVGAPGPDTFWVIKEMSVTYQDPAEQATAIELFQREGELLQRLDHKNLPKVIDRFYHGGKYHFVMEYVEGEDLGKMIARNPQGLPENVVLPWGIEIATVLYYLHMQKPPIIFRDIKPSNIMIAKGSVKLIDFGIARAFKPNKKKDTISIGSPGYAPPEQYSGQTDPRSDVYALGATMHHLLTGKDPTETRTPFKFEAVNQVKPGISQVLSDIVGRSVDIDPARRYQSALEFKKVLQAAAGVQTGPMQPMGGRTQQAGGPSGTRPTGPPPSIPKGPTGTTAISGPPPLPSILPNATPPPAALTPVPVPENVRNAPPPPTPTGTAAVVPGAPPGAPATPTATAATPKTPMPTPPAHPLVATLRRTVIKLVLCALLAAGIRIYKYRILEYIHPQPKPIPTPVVTDAMQDAKELMKQGRYRDACLWLDDWMEKHASDLAARLLLETAYAHAATVEAANALRVAHVVMILPADTPHREAYERGALVAVQQFNRQGGCHGTLAGLSVVETATDAANSDVAAIVPVGVNAGDLPALVIPSPGQEDDRPGLTSPGSEVWWSHLAEVLGKKPEALSILAIGSHGIPESMQKQVQLVGPEQIGSLPAKPFDVVVPLINGPHLGDTLRTLMKKLPKTPVWLPPGVIEDGPESELPDGVHGLTWWWPGDVAPRGATFLQRFARVFGKGRPGFWEAEGANAVLALQSAFQGQGMPTRASVAEALKSSGSPTMGVQDPLPLGGTPAQPTWVELKVAGGHWKP